VTPVVLRRQRGLSRVHRPSSIGTSCYPGPGNLSPSTDTRMLTCRCTSWPGLSNTPAVPLTRFLKCDRLQPHLEPPRPSLDALPWMAMQAADAPCQIAQGSNTHLPAPAAGSPSRRSSRPILSSARFQCCLCLPALPDLRAIVRDILSGIILQGSMEMISFMACLLARSKLATP
jgi:hypothetical protein